MNDIINNIFLFKPWQEQHHQQARLGQTNKEGGTNAMREHLLQHHTCSDETGEFHKMRGQ